MKTSLNRRTFLRGSGVAIALPMFESMAPLGRAAPAPGKPVKRMICLSNNYGIYAKAFFPGKDQPGSAYDLPGTLQPLEKHRKDFTVFSNLDHGLSGGHQCVPTLLNGMRPDMSANFPEGNISLDQKIAESLGATTRFSSLVLKAKENNQISYSRAGVQIPSLDLRGLYRKLFLGDSAEAIVEERRRLKRDSSILDVVLGKAKTVHANLSRQDQSKFEEYLDSVRTLEKKIVQREPWLDRAKPEAPYKEPVQTGSADHDFQLMMDLIALAVQTDSTRAITLAMGFGNGDFGINGGYHGYSHHGELEEKTQVLKQVDAHMMTQLAHLIDLLKAQPDELNGEGTLFDHTMILFGCGMATGTHSTKNLPLLLAGGGFKLGEHLVLPEEKGQRILASNLLLSMAQNFGLEIDRFGNSSGTLRGLEWKT
jgi:hypothetical protein